MSLTANQDYVFIPKITLVLNGVTFASLIATRKYIFIVPFENIADAGSKVATTTFSIDQKNPQEFLSEFLKDSDLTVAKLEESLMKIINNDPQSYLEIATLQEFNIKASFFSKGIYYKKAGDRGFKGIGVSGKENALALKQFYGK